MSQPFDNRDWDVRRIAELEAEIGRLKAEIKDQMTLIEDINYQKQLITELADALLAYYYRGDTTSLNVYDLLQRARELCPRTNAPS